MKICVRCNSPKNEEEFFKNRGYSDSLDVYCKDCRRSYVKSWKEKHPNYHTEWSRYNYQNNENYRRLKNRRSRQWSIKNYEQNKEYAQKYYQENIDHLKAMQKEWREKNKGKTKSNKAKYRAILMNNGGIFTPDEWNDLCAQFDYRCAYCGKKRNLEADHIIPVSKGGTSNISNIQPLCRTCNARKGASL